ncbi:MAG: 2-succinyl-5-enolpyruvyl-6-hydroxy-3-cyclohexene-1-carboxylic-acid synthase [Chitinophagales bacterium]|nr:2-succinyl-5-enolpyruvyl-6-hydroxy-3-cyclohexene-1-carboxylic-acid synthase [Chitinophagales bacterium]
MNTAKEGIQAIAETCYRRGIRKVVFSPGSRSAPLVIAFSQLPDVECLVIPDERVAGYFALGMAQQLRETVAVVCTSGTAVLNLLPACCEALYQQVPLLFLTADRPPHAASDGENQAINQIGIFESFASDYNVDADKDAVASIIQTTEVAIFDTQSTKTPARINVHLREPLYEFTERKVKLPQKQFQPEALANTIKDRIEAQQRFAYELADSPKKLIVAGLRNAENKFRDTIAQLATRKDTVVFVESTSNCNVKGCVYDFDSCIELMDTKSIKTFVPNMVVTLGNQIVSKRLKEWLRKYKPRYHWDIDQYSEMRNRDYFLLNNEYYPCITEAEALECLLETPEQENTFAHEWATVAKHAATLKFSFLQNALYSDFTVFEKLIASLPEGANVQYGNSTPVRYSNLFLHKNSVSVNANRGTSGIDGCVSTAAGAAYANNKLTVCIVGDVSFFYDSNALWNNYLSPNFRIIIINNSGGNIFRLIDGPAQINNFEKFFETPHSLNAQHLASMYNIHYYFSDRFETLEEILPTFYAPQTGQRPAILEIKTNNITDAAVYKQYFDYLRNNR